MRNHFIRLLILLLLSTYIPCLALSTANIAGKTEALQIELLDKSFFTDRIATAQILHTQPLTLDSEAPFTDSMLKLLSVSSQARQGKNALRYQTHLRFLPQTTGKLQFPALHWEASTGLIQTRAIDFEVDTLQKSSAMQLSIRAHKQEVFIGEPLKISLIWSGSVDINRLQELKLYPDFFNMEGIEVVIPRTSTPPDAQIGLPLGGRRILARRESPSPQKLGKIHLDLFLRFHKTGKFKFSASRLECGLIASSKRKFAPYAAHFNNAFFERLDTKLTHQRLYVDSKAFEVQVSALPANTSGHPFTGLFTPINFVASTSTSAPRVGQLIPLAIDLNSLSTPHEWLKLPKSQLHNQLKGHFWTDQSPSQYWRAQGSRYETRLRALSTQVKAIPELEFLCFDAPSKSFQLITSPALPIEVLPAQGQNFIPLNTFLVTPRPFNKDTSGIWYPQPRSLLSTMLNAFIVFANQHFLLLLTALIALFTLILHCLYKGRRSCSGRNAKACKQAYRRFQKKPVDHPEKWTHFLDFLALSLQINTASMTKEEALRALQSLHLEVPQLTEIERFFQQVEERTYSPRPHKINFRTLEPIAKTIRKHAEKLSLLSLILTTSLLLQPMEASPESHSLQTLQQAELAEAGSQAARLLYTEAALQFESLAQDPYEAAEAWSHAGHAWFQAQALGRALAAYRIAHSYRPFDAMIQENIHTIRALVSSAHSHHPFDSPAIPTRWLRASLLVILTFFCGCLLLRFRYRKRAFLYATGLMATCLIFTASLLLYRAFKPQQEGVVIARSTEARKGPSYHFTPAFKEAVQEGVEFKWIHQEKDWYFVHLYGGSTCWLHRSQIQIFEL